MAMHTIEDIRRTVCSLNEEYGVHRVVLFGSYARGQQGKTSDVDLYIVAGAVDFLRVCAFGYDLKANLKIGIDIVIEEYMNISADLMADIQNDGVILYEKE